MKKILYRKDTKPWRFTLLRGGSPINLTGKTFWLSAKQNVDDSSYLFNKAGSNTVAAEGIATVTLNSVDTTTSCENAIVDAVLITDSDGTQDTLDQFFVEIKKDIKTTPA